ncbi:fucosyltransferase 4 (alpha (1 3) fucosyltransferase myeloid-specific) [Mactra antiquata]
MKIDSKTGICAFVVSVAFTLLSMYLFSWLLGAIFGESSRHDMSRASSMRTNMDTSISRLVDLTFVSEDLMINILWINKPVWVNLQSINQGLAITCPYKNCRMTDNAKNIKQNSALVFSAQDELIATIHPKNKPFGQVWIFLRMEPPTRDKVRWISDPIWSKTMNWSWGYRLDSDIFRPVQTLVTRKTPPERNYIDIFKRKTKVAAWVVSNCKTQSRRVEYVEQLIRYGVPIDVIGKCSREKQKIDSNSIEALINKHYKFYLSFENSFCKDYVTEKFYSYYNLDVITIVRGGINYTQHFDGTTFINAADFKSAKALANYILLLNSDEELYIKYLKQKDRYEAKSIQAIQHETNCRLCERLNNKEKYYNLYENISKYIFKDTCYTPTDL